jgi:hypothetical protein
MMAPSRLAASPSRTVRPPHTGHPRVPRPSVFIIDASEFWIARSMAPTRWRAITSESARGCAEILHRCKCQTANPETRCNAPRRDAPELLQERDAQKQRAWGMPGAQCTRSLVCAGVVSMHTSIHSGGTGNHPAFPHAMVLTVYFALSSESDALLPPSSRGLKVLSDPVEPNEPPQDLTRASRRQDHATSPSADSPRPRQGLDAACPCRSLKLQRGMSRRSLSEGGRKIQRRRLRVRGVRSRRSIRPATPPHA